LANHACIDHSASRGLYRVLADFFRQDPAIGL
jgi:hypothetical protein